MTTPDTSTDHLSEEPISLVEYRAGRMLDALDCAAYIWMGEAQIPVMVANATSPAQNQKPVPQSFVERMLEQVESIVHLAFVEGAYRSTEILDGHVKQLRAERDALTAKVAALESRAEKAEVEIGDLAPKLVDLEWDNKELEAELAAARAPVGDAEIAEVVEYIKSQDGWASTVTRGPNPTSFSTDFDEIAPFKAADIITRLSRERGEARAALTECVETLALVESVPFEDPDYGAEVRRLGERIGFGALMSSASASWAKVLAERGDPAGSQFVSGPCHATVERTLKIARAALKEKAHDAD